MRASVRGTEIYFDVEGAALVPDGPTMREKPIAFVLHGGLGGDHTGFETWRPAEGRSAPPKSP